MVHDERGGEAEQRLDRQERDLPAGCHWPAAKQRGELLAGLADRQLQVVGQIGHGVRLLPGHSISIAWLDERD